MHEFAPAKINLSLRVLGKRDDGYHALHSLVAFAGFGDELNLDPQDNTLSATLSIIGPMAAHLPTDANNLILKAARAFKDTFPDTVTGVFTLTKHLPVASGIGGGSSNAAAALRVLARLNAVPLDDKCILAIAEKLGSDVPVCLAPYAQWMAGRGETITPLAGFPTLFAILVNPGVQVPTATVFKAWQSDPDATAITQPSDFTTQNALMDYLDQHPNDLEVHACSIAPVIGETLKAVRSLPECSFARMSGSGATVFGIFTTQVASEEAARLLRTHHPDWWIVPTLIGNAHS